MKFFKRLGFAGILMIICALLGACASFVICSYTDVGLTTENWIKWAIFLFVVLLLFSNVFFSHKITVGRVQEILFYSCTVLLMSACIAYVIYCFLSCNFDFAKLDWAGFLVQIVNVDVDFYMLTVGVFLLFSIIYGAFINRTFFRLFSRTGVIGKGKLKQVDTNLENSRWMNNSESHETFKYHNYSNLRNIKKDGIPVRAVVTNNGKDISVAFNSPCHSIIIGSTGSGKTTTFVSPMIQLLGATNAGSSMIITDPKGELFSLHSKYLKSRGYDVKVIDLRDTYSSYRWNPLESIWDTYQQINDSQNKVELHVQGEELGDLQPVGNPEDFKTVDKWYEFEGKAYSSYDSLIEAIKVYRKKVYDEVYEDLNDLVSVLIPVENEKDPMWEKGARSIALAVLLAMLEDSEEPENEMTKEKFNFYNMTKILQNSNDDYEELRNYFKGRSTLSKAYSLSKQVCDAATQTRASYMSIVYEKLTLFNDAGICALTSASDFSSEQLAHKPTALFLKIPDEKDTRHNLAAIFILNIYKTLIKVASATEELTLERNVYFIMDEFGNMPKIEKFDKFITVGRSRKIWFTMIIQSYAQLNNVYGETVAEIVKGNCGIKMFIGSNDMGTCKEYSELCGNITVATTSTSGSVYSKDVNISTQTQVRPLIYPSELQRLNKPGDIGHSIIVTFGNYPFKTQFTPSFKCKLYQIGKMDTSENERFFDENSIFYSVKKRNETVFAKSPNEETENTAIENPDDNGGGQSARPQLKLSIEPQPSNAVVPTSDELDMIIRYREYKKQKENEEMTKFFDTIKEKPSTATKTENTKTKQGKRNE